MFLLDSLTGQVRYRLPAGDNGFSAHGDWVLSWPVKGRRLRAWNVREEAPKWQRMLPTDGCSASAEASYVLVSCPGQVEIRRWSDGSKRWSANGTLRGRSDALILVEREGRLRALDVDTAQECYSRVADIEQACLIGSSLYGIAERTLVRIDLATGAVAAERTGISRRDRQARSPHGQQHSHDCAVADVRGGRRTHHSVKRT